MKTFGWRNEEGYILQLYMFKGGSSLLEFPMGRKTLANREVEPPTSINWTGQEHIILCTVPGSGSSTARLWKVPAVWYCISGCSLINSSRFNSGSAPLSIIRF